MLFVIYFIRVCWTIDPVRQTSVDGRGRDRRRNTGRIDGANTDGANTEGEHANTDWQNRGIVATLGGAPRSSFAQGRAIINHY